MLHPMSDDFRTRVAAALLGDHCIQGMTQPCDDCREHALRQADAVIRELGLREERTESETVTNDQGATFYREGGYRYISDWTADG